jgi:hypothetical protein
VRLGCVGQRKKSADSDEEEVCDTENLKKMFMGGLSLNGGGGGSKKMPGETPMNTQMEEDI